MGMLRLETPKLETLGKKGILKKDDEGYYQICIGALDIKNSVGETYPFDYNRSFFTPKSPLMRRIRNGQLVGEYGHPKPLPGMSKRDWMRRCLDFDYDRICVHFKDVWLDVDNKVNGSIPIMAWLKPHGPKGDHVLEGLENKDFNVAFSIRAMSKPMFVGGNIFKYFTVIWTWDYVIEPGIGVASKWDTTSLESHTETLSDGSSPNDISLMDVNALLNMQCQGECSLEDNSLEALKHLKKEIENDSKIITDFKSPWMKK